MTRRILSVMALAMAAALVGGAAADAGSGEQLIQRLDRDGDGLISREEAQAFRGGRFEEMDLDGDGAVSRSEMMERVRQRVADELGQRFERLDSDGDGRIDRSEYQSRESRSFERLDRDGDGMISVEELRRGNR